MYDIIIIGGGPAAVAAGIYAARKKAKTLVVTKDWGGQMAYAPLVRNYPGLDNITGLDLNNKFVEHLKANELDIKEGEEVREIGLIDKSIVEIKTKDNTYQGKVLIMATGRVARKLGVPGEEKFFGKGVTY